LQDELQVPFQIGGIRHADDQVGFRLAGQLAVERGHRHFFIG
jgi:hypothetical protein